MAAGVTTPLTFDDMHKYLVSLDKHISGTLAKTRATSAVNAANAGISIETHQQPYHS